MLSAGTADEAVAEECLTLTLNLTLTLTLTLNLALLQARWRC